jgi:hypothetical protein
VIDEWRIQIDEPRPGSLIVGLDSH